VQAMISAAPANPDLANPDLALPRPAARALRLSSENNELAPGFVPARFALPASPCQLHPASFTGAAAKEEDPGSAFGPESIPLATGLVSVVYWVPGPFPGPTPRPAG